MTCNNDLRYEFGPYQLDPSKRILTREGEGIPLTPKATDILILLVKQAGQLVEKDELLKEVWPDTFVEEANLSQNIFTLRRALGDDRAEPKYIETIAKRGYRFTSSVQTIGVDEYEPQGSSNYELVDVVEGWQLWGETVDSESKDLLEIQESITRHLIAALKLTLTGAEEKQIAARYTENPAVYQAYLEGRYHWSRYTRKGIEKAIEHFRRAVDVDPNYALAYAAIVDCYLRLATNYLPPEDNGLAIARISKHESDPIEIRFEWDWRSVERELRRANELKIDYPSPHQWHFAYTVSKQLYRESLSAPSLDAVEDRRAGLASQIPSIPLAPAEEIQILCSVARDQMAIGNFDAANLVLNDALC
jgi:DNA-binding winged helix-turn-helix (wHTH) protein